MADLTACARDAGGSESVCLGARLLANVLITLREALLGYELRERFELPDYGLPWVSGFVGGRAGGPRSISGSANTVRRWSASLLMTT